MNKNELYTKLEEMSRVMTAEEIVEELFQAMSTDEAEANLRWIDQCHDLGIFDEDEEEEEDEDEDEE